MVQGKVKHKTVMPKNIKQKSDIRINKAIDKKKGKIVEKRTIQKIIKHNLENVSKQSIEQNLCQQAKSCEGKSFKMLK
jgi:hypothetical protein